MLPYVSDSEILALPSEEFNFFKSAESFRICSYIIRKTAQWPNLIHGCEVLKPDKFVQQPPWPQVSLMLIVDKNEYDRLGHTGSAFNLESKFSSFYWYQMAFNLDPKLPTAEILTRMRGVKNDKELAVKKEEDPEFGPDETKPDSSMTHDIGLAIKSANEYFIAAKRKTLFVDNRAT
ncbi:hypothetical protein T265_10796 [Opisthorchis viverrini]|uniref:Uncharacterized protein n=1 Tax=Opisthorchis viverrini TaxID=6198 RepID=A0A074ZBZ6_OPIVI|nr:hypothetical protein T265_10796 [Opisthorchis viverrini]KER20720.1 hypothetical protein T265_10796 [Opisthorchis viverrini]